MSWIPTTYLGTPSVERREDGALFILTGNPPIWGARVKRVSDDLWRTTFHGPMPHSSVWHTTPELALQAASVAVGMLVGEWWRSQMSGYQRTLIGRLRVCPMIMFESELARHCQAPPAPGSVWCEAHPWGQT